MKNSTWGEVAELASVVDVPSGAGYAQRRNGNIQRHTWNPTD